MRSRSNDAGGWESGATLGVALSGGGVRASLFALGALMFLVDSRLNRRVTEIASVSGGSITNAFVAQRCDFRVVDPETFDATSRELALAITKGLVGKRRVLAGLGVAVFVVAAIVVFSWPVDLPWWADAVVLAGWGLLLLLRGALLTRFLDRRLYRSSPLRTLSALAERATTHVFCATDLNSSSPIYLSTRAPWLFSPFWGFSPERERLAELRVVDAVRASAAFPGGLPPKRLRVGPLRLRPTTGTYVARWDELGFHAVDRASLDALYLVDGGVWNNLGTDWFSARTQRQLPSGFDFDVDRAAVEQYVVVDASAPVLGSPKMTILRIPWLAEVASVVRVLVALSVSTVTGRIEALRDTSTEGGAAAGGASCVGVVRIVDTSPPDRWLDQVWTALPKKGRLMVTAGAVPTITAMVPTTLFRIAPHIGLALVVHGYLATRDMLIRRGLASLLPPPPLSRFAELFGLHVIDLSGGRAVVLPHGRRIEPIKEELLATFVPVASVAEQLHDSSHRMDAVAAAMADAVDELRHDHDARETMRAGMDAVEAASSAASSGEHQRAIQLYGDVLSQYSPATSWIGSVHLAQYAKLLGDEHDERGEEIARFAEEKAEREAGTARRQELTAYGIDPRILDGAAWHSVARAYAANRDAEGAIRALRRQLELEEPPHRLRTYRQVSMGPEFAAVRDTSTYRRFIGEAVAEWLGQLIERVGLLEVEQPVQDHLRRSLARAQGMLPDLEEDGVNTIVGELAEFVDAAPAPDETSEEDQRIARDATTLMHLLRSVETREDP